MKIRVATESDAPSVQSMAYSAMYTYGLVPDPDGVDFALGHFGESFDGLLIQLVAYLNDDIVGCITLSRKNFYTGKISGFYVEYALRGQGIGAALIEAIIQHAQSIGLSGIYLETWGKMEAAVALYRKYGWRHTEDLPQDSGAERAFFLQI